MTAIQFLRSRTHEIMAERRKTKENGLTVTVEPVETDEDDHRKMEPTDQMESV